MVSARHDTSRLRLYLLPDGADFNPHVGKGLIQGPRFRDAAFEDRIIAVAPITTADPGKYCEFLTTLETLPDWATGRYPMPEQLTDEPNKIRLFLVSEELKPGDGHIRGPRPFEDDLLKPRTMIALPGAPAPQGGAFITTLNELPDWAKGYDSQRSQAHARKIRRVAASRGPS